MGLYKEWGENLSDTIDRMNEDLMGKIGPEGTFMKDMFSGFRSNMETFAINIADTMSAIKDTGRKFRGGDAVMGGGWSGSNLYQKQEMDKALSELRLEQDNVRVGAYKNIVDEIQNTRDFITSELAEYEEAAHGEDELPGGYDSSLVEQWENTDYYDMLLDEYGGDYYDMFGDEDED